MGKYIDGEVLLYSSNVKAPGVSFPPTAKNKKEDGNELVCRRRGVEQVVPRGTNGWTSRVVCSVATCNYTLRSYSESQFVEMFTCF